MARQGLDKASRQTAAKAGTALPNGKYPIRTRGELNAAIKLRHHIYALSGPVMAGYRRFSKSGV